MPRALDPRGDRGSVGLLEECRPLVRQRTHTVSQGEIEPARDGEHAIRTFVAGCLVVVVISEVCVPCYHIHFH